MQVLLLSTLCHNQCWNEHSLVALKVGGHYVMSRDVWLGNGKGTTVQSVNLMYQAAKICVLAIQGRKATKWATVALLVHLEMKPTQLERAGPEISACICLQCPKRYSR
jgi:hypothetical protein